MSLITPSNPLCPYHGEIEIAQGRTISEATLCRILRRIASTGKLPAWAARANIPWARLLEARKRTGMTETEYWKWLGDYAVHCLQTSKFAVIHPAKPREEAGKAFGFDHRDVPAMWAWQKKHAAKIKRTINAAVKPHGYRLARHRSGYARLERIPA